MESELNRLLDALPAMVWTAGDDGETNFVNKHWCDYTGLTLEEATAAGWSSMFHPDDVATAMAAWASTRGASPPLQINLEARLRRADGVYRRFRIETRRIHDAAGAPTGWCGINTDIENQARAEAQLAGEKRLFELIARGTPLKAFVEDLCGQVENLSPGSLCSVLFIDADRKHFRVGAGPGLPAGYNRVLEGLEIDANFGPCSRAFETRSTVIVVDPPGDLRWGPVWPQLMVDYGLGSCWSAPIVGSSDEVTGIFAIYRQEAVGPTAEERELVDRFANIAGIAIDRAESDTALHAGEAELRRMNHFLNGAQRLSKTGSFFLDTVTDEQIWSEENFRIWGFDPAVPPTMDRVTAAIHHEDLEATLKTFSDATAAGRDFEAFYRIVTPHGGVKHLHTVMEIIPEFTDRVVYLGSSQDITETRLAEETLRASEAGLRRANQYLAGAQKLSKTGSFTWNVDTDEQDWSEELYRIWEIDPTEDHPVPWLHAAVLHPDDVDGVEAIQAPAFEAGEGFEVSYRIITRSGAIKHLHTVNQRVAEIPDQLVYIGATQDLTERRLAEQALKDSEAELRRAHDHLAQAQQLSHTGSFTTDAETDTHAWSDELYRILEFEIGTAVSFKDFHSLIHPEDQAAFDTAFKLAMKDGADFDHVFRLTTPEGTAKYLHAVAKRVEGRSAVFMGSIQDVTGSKLSEEALRVSEAGLRRANQYLAGAQKLSKTGSFTLDVATGEQDWSEELYRIWGLGPEDDRSVATLHATVVHPDDVEALRAVAGPAIAARRGYEISYRIVTRDGTIKHLRTVRDPVPDITDRLVYIGATQDVTESKLAEQALKDSEARLARANRYLTAAQTLSRIGSFTWDLETDELDWSDENFRIWGVDPMTPPTMDTILNGIHPDDVARVAGIIADGKRTGADFDVFYRIITPAGEVKHLHTVSTRIPEVTDRLLYIGSNQDVTAAKLAEAELATANTYLNSAQRLTQTGSFTWDVAADEHNWSEVIYRIFGFEPGSRVTMDMMMPAIHPEDLSLVEALIAGAQIGKNFELIFRIFHTSGEIRHAHLVGRRIDQTEDRPVFMGAMQDITARKLAESDLNRARAELSRMSRVTALSALTASIAHEVNQPLAGIITNANTCLRMLAADPPDVEGATATAQRTIRDGYRASEVIKRLRSLFTRTPPSLEPVDLADAANEVIALSATELQRRRVVVQTDLAKGTAAVEADRIQLQQVLLNLILNAADAMSEIEDRARELRVISRRAPDGWITVKVSDNGPGIAADDAEQLFQPFHTTKPDGMGIGLSISKSIIEAHGGRISAAPNDPAPGATFTFSIPPRPPVAAAPGLIQ